MGTKIMQIARNSMGLVKIVFLYKRVLFTVYCFHSIKKGGIRIYVEDTGSCIPQELPSRVLGRP